MRNPVLLYSGLPILLFFFIFALGLPTYGQSNMDSLLNNVVKAPGVTMIKSLSIKANEKSAENPKEAIRLSIEAVELSKKAKFAEGLIFNYRLLGNLYYHTHNYEEAINSFDQCIEYVLLQNDSVTIRECYLNKGAMFFTQGLNSKALDNYLLALKYSENLDKEIEYNNIGTVFFIEEEYEEAYNYYRKSLEIMKAKGNQYGVSAANNNIGDVYKMMGKYDTALSYYTKALTISKSIGDKSSMIVYLNNIGEIKAIMNDPDSAIFYFNNALQIAEKLNNQLLITRSLNQLGQAYFDANDYSNAKKYLTRSYPIAKDLKVFPEMSMTAGLLHTIFENEGNYKLAYKYAIMHKLASDSLRNNEAKKQVLKILFDYKIKLKESETQKLVENEKHERRKSAFKLWTIISLLIILLLIGILLQVRVRQRMKFNRIEREKAELQRINLVKELEFKNREIVEKVLSIVEKNELIETTIKRLNEFMLLLPQSKKPEIRLIIKSLKNQEIKNQWEEFHFYFTKIYTKFFEKLEKDYPSLTTNEKRLCAFLKLNMSTKDIATLTHQNYKSIEVARTRLRKRFNLTNSNMSFQEFFSQYN